MDEITKYYDSNYKRMVKIAYNITKQSCDAEDIVQESFSRALKYYNSFNSEISTLHQWVNGIFSRCVKDFQRDAMLQGMSVEIKEEDASTSETTGEDNKALEEVKALIDNIKGVLSKQICYLYFIREYTPREIAQVVDSTPGFIRFCVCSFRKDLKVVYG